MKTAIITGITGQDGSYLSELLLKKDYMVYGLDRRKADASKSNIKHLLDNENFEVLDGDLLEESRLNSIVKMIHPDELYHLAAQSFVKSSWDVPLYTCNVNALGTLRLLEAIRIFSPATKFYNASSNEIFGLIQETPQKEMTYQYPRSPHGCSKSFAHSIVRNYRESYNLFCCNGICFNHESERRGLEFVTRKITNAVARIKCGLQDKLILGNLDVERDWGHASDYVRAMWMMLQHDIPDDYVISSGESHSVREFVEIAFYKVGINIEWAGKGITEKGIDLKTGVTLVEISNEFYRPSEVNLLLGDSTKIRKTLGWEPKISFDEMIRRMIEHDLSTMEDTKVERKTSS